MGFNPTQIRRDYEYFSPTLFSHFCEALHKCEPDIVHIHNLRRLSLDIAEYIKTQNIPIVTTVHDYWFRCPMGALLDFNDQVCSRLPGVDCLSCLWPERQSYRRRKAIPWRLINPLRIGLHKSQTYFGNRTRRSKGLLDWLSSWERDFRQFLGCADVIIAPSETLARKLIEFGADEKKTLWLQHALSDAVLERAKHTPPSQFNADKKLHIGFIGRHWLKGPHVMIAALRQIDPSLVVLHIWGGLDHPPAMKLEQLATQEGYQIVNHPPYAQDKMPNVFEKIDLLIVPSIWYETGPLVILESFAHKTPVIASNIGGMAELVAHNETGLLFNAGDPADLAQKINDVLAQPGLVKKFCENLPRPKSMTEYSRHVLSLYESLAKV